MLLANADDSLLVAVASDEVKSFATDGTPLGSFGTHGAGAGQFDFGIAAGETPSLAVAGDGALLIAEPGNHRIHRWVAGASAGWLGGGSDGFVSTAPCCNAGEDGGWFDRPRGVAVDVAGHIFVADLAGGGRLQKFDPSGRLLWQNALGFEPGGLYIDFQGLLWISDVTGDLVHQYRI